MKKRRMTELWQFKLGDEAAFETLGFKYWEDSSTSPRPCGWARVISVLEQPEQYAPEGQEPCEYELSLSIRYDLCISDDVGGSLLDNFEYIYGGSFLVLREKGRSRPLAEDELPLETLRDLRAFLKHFSLSPSVSSVKSAVKTSSSHV